VAAKHSVKQTHTFFSSCAKSILHEKMSAAGAMFERSIFFFRGEIFSRSLSRSISCA